MEINIRHLGKVIDDMQIKQQIKQLFNETRTVVED